MSKILRNALMAVTLLTAPSVALAKTPSAQAQLDTFTRQLGYHITVDNNGVTEGCLPKQACAAFTFTLTTPRTLPQSVAGSDWAIYASFIQPIMPTQNGIFDFTRINGDFYRITLKPGAKLAAGQTYTSNLLAPAHIYTPYFFFPNAYIVAGKLKPSVIAASRAGIDAETGQETLPFVTPFTDEARLANNAPGVDHVAWLTPERLYDQTAQREAATPAPEFIILPTPVSASHLPGAAIALGKGVAVSLSGVTPAEVAVALKALKAAGIAESKTGVPLTITIAAGQPESYHIVAKDGAVTITAADAAGASYALRSLAQQAAYEHGQLKPLEITDAPRFAYRGLHMDMARNFESKGHILAVIDEMAALKLNKLHLHLGDDEGWRLAIDGLPELTEIGSKRCHDLAEDTCLLPQLGAGPDNAPGVNGYLTRADYIEILKAAKARQIEVIPSFDMPGHSRAAVRSMEARYRRLMAAGKPVEASQYRLQDPDDTTAYISIQDYHDNTLNICLPSTYAFIDKVMESIKAMHDEAGEPLRIYHIGTDETAGAWVKSPACQKIMADKTITVQQLGASFITQVSDILGKKGIEPAGWSDGMGSVDPAQMPKKVQSNSWGSLFSGGGADAYRQANQGWDVVMSTPDVLYFDMPNAADGQERGYDWASRQTDIYKVFAFLPENLGANAVLMPNYIGVGQTIADPTPLQPGHRIAGMQGQIWSETTRSDRIADYLLFPRTLALAERAWHRAGWEPDYVAGKSYSYNDGSVDTAKVAADWQGFQARLLPQLSSLDAAGLTYRLPVPGAHIAGGKLEANTPIAGLAIQYKQTGTWKPYTGPVAVSGPVSLRIVSPNGKRVSRTVVVKP